MSYWLEFRDRLCWAHLGSMGHLCWLLLWHIHVLPHADPYQEEYCMGQLTA